MKTIFIPIIEKSEDLLPVYNAKQKDGILVYRKETNILYGIVVYEDDTYSIIDTSNQEDFKRSKTLLELIKRHPTFIFKQL